MNGQRAHTDFSSGKGQWKAKGWCFLNLLSVGLHQMLSEIAVTPTANRMHNHDQITGPHGSRKVKHHIVIFFLSRVNKKIKFTIQGEAQGTSVLSRLSVPCDTLFWSCYDSHWFGIWSLFLEEVKKRTGRKGRKGRKRRKRRKHEEGEEKEEGEEEEEGEEGQNREREEGREGGERKRGKRKRNCLNCCHLHLMSILHQNLLLPLLLGRSTCHYVLATGTVGCFFPFHLFPAYSKTPK